MSTWQAMKAVASDYPWLIVAMLALSWLLNVVLFSALNQLNAELEKLGKRNNLINRKRINHNE